MKTNRLLLRIFLILIIATGNIPLSMNQASAQNSQVYDNCLDSIPIASISMSEVDKFLNIPASQIVSNLNPFKVNSNFAFANLPIIHQLMSFQNSVSNFAKTTYFNNIQPILPLDELVEPKNVLTDFYNTNTDNVIIIDNDELKYSSQSVEYANLPTDDSKTKIIAGATFPVVIISEISSKSAKVGDPIQARLKYDLKIGDRLIARKGAVVNGHLNYVLKARTPIRSMASTNRWYKTSGCLGIAFDDLINVDGGHVPLVATPARCARIINNKAEGRLLGINHNGQIAGPWSQQLAFQAIKIGLNAALAPAGVFSFGAMPIACGLIGAANPSLVFMKPIGLNVRHRRLKGFAWGVLAGVPGSFLIEGSIIKGQEAIIKPGDELLAQFKEEFTGIPYSDAEYAGAMGKVHGEVLPKSKKTTKH